MLTLSWLDLNSAAPSASVTGRNSIRQIIREVGMDPRPNNRKLLNSYTWVEKQAMRTTRKEVYTYLLSWHNVKLTDKN